jgi:hypothetical protein
MPPRGRGLRPVGRPAPEAFRDESSRGHCLARRSFVSFGRPGRPGRLYTRPGRPPGEAGWQTHPFLGSSLYGLEPRLGGNSAERGYADVGRDARPLRREHRPAAFPRPGGATRNHLLHRQRQPFIRCATARSPGFRNLRIQEARHLCGPEPQRGPLLQGRGRRAGFRQDHLGQGPYPVRPAPDRVGERVCEAASHTRQPVYQDRVPQRAGHRDCRDPERERPRHRVPRADALLRQRAHRTVQRLAEEQAHPRAVDQAAGRGGRGGRRPGAASQNRRAGFRSQGAV